MKYRFTFKIFFLMVVMTIAMQPSFAQHTIRGIVVDAASRQPLEYASVSTENIYSKKTFTDQYGNFDLTINNTDSQLIVCSVGYKTVTAIIPEEREIKVELQKDLISLKDVVVSVNSSVAKFSSLAKIDLELKPVKNTQELLNLVPGLFIAQHAGGGKAEQIFLRGFDCDHGTDVQVSVDGMPVNMVSHAHGQGYADAHFIIAETINSIDFGAGPYYTAQGNLNTAGFVSFSTFNSIAKSTIQAEAGRYNTVRTLAMIDLLKKNKDKQSAYIAGEYYFTNGSTVNKQLFNRFNIFGKYNVALSSRSSLTASLSAFKSNWNASGQVPERAVAAGLIDRFGSIDPSEGGQTARYNANLLLAHHFNNGLLWENQFYYSRYHFKLYSNFTFFLNNAADGDQILQAESRNVFGYLSKITQQYKLKNWMLRSTYGAGFRHDASSNSQLVNAVKRRFLSNVQLGDIKETNAYAYVQQQLQKGRWLIDAGVRLDYFYFNYFNKLTAVQNTAQTVSIVSPKLNIQYSLHPGLQFFIKTGKGFHSNDVRVVTANNGKEILPAAYGADMGVLLKPAKNFVLSIAAWYLHLQQEFVYVGDAGITEPSGQTKRRGIDIIARYQFSKNLFANLNFNYTKARAVNEPKGQNYIPLAPALTGTGGLFYKAAKGLNGSLTYRYIKNRPANEDNSITAHGYFLLDAAINYTKPGYEIGIAIENLTNTAWNEAQFATTSRLKDEPTAVTELHYTPGTPFFPRVKLAVFF